jgi:hypothetical protein
MTPCKRVAKKPHAFPLPPFVKGRVREDFAGGSSQIAPAPLAERGEQNLS